MSILAIAVKHLVALGMSGDDLAAAIKEMEAAQDTRSAGAKRQERYRRNKASQSVTYNECDAPPLPPLDKEIPPTPPKEINPPLYPPVSDETDSPSADDFFEVWGDLVRDYGLPAIRKMDPSRKRRVIGVLRRYTTDEIIEAFANIRASPFLLGQRGKTPLCIDWLTKPENFRKVLEGNYNDKPPSSRLNGYSH